MEQYTVLEQMGSGATSDVFLVEDRRSKRQYIMKQMPTTGMSDQEKLRARQEMHILQRIDHPNIVKYRESFDHPDAMCIVMERCATSLEQVIEKKREECLHGSSGPFSTNTLLEWMAELLSAVHYLHRQKIIHRDIKPSNIFVTSTNHLKLGDFGVCKVLTSGGGSTMVSSSMVAASHGAMIGTPLYFAPEIFESDTPQYSEASDVWSLGLVFYEMCALRPALEANNFFALMHAIINQEIAPFGNGVDQRFERITRRMLSRNPAERPTTQQLIDRYVVVPASHPSHPAQRPERGRLLQERHGVQIECDVSSSSACSSSDTTQRDSHIAPPSGAVVVDHHESQEGKTAMPRTGGCDSNDVSSISKTTSESTSTSSDGEADAPPKAVEKHAPVTGQTHTACGQARGASAPATMSSPSAAGRIVKKPVGPASPQAQGRKAPIPAAAALARKPSSRLYTSSHPQPSLSVSGHAASASSPPQRQNSGVFLAPSDHEDALKRIREAKSKINVSELRLRMKGQPRTKQLDNILVVSPVPSASVTENAGVDLTTSPDGHEWDASPPLQQRHRDPSVSVEEDCETTTDVDAVVSVSSPVQYLSQVLHDHEQGITLEDLDHMALLLHQFKLRHFGVL